MIETRDTSVRERAGWLGLRREKIGEVHRRVLPTVKVTDDNGELLTQITRLEFTGSIAGYKGKGGPVVKEPNPDLKSPENGDPEKQKPYVLTVDVKKTRRILGIPVSRRIHHARKHLREAREKMKAEVQRQAVVFRRERDEELRKEKKPHKK